jgi:hypothetical protein
VTSHSTRNGSAVPAYRPVIGGVRHRITCPVQPPDGSVVRLLCGGTYQVGSRRKSPPVHDCSRCAEAAS